MFCKSSKKGAIDKRVFTDWQPIKELNFRMRKNSSQFLYGIKKLLVIYLYLIEFKILSYA
ncbi:hypothetical protein DR980_15115 [Flavobacterium psychrolimnae]|uniref:Uncharacterized protein n=1 Tax=Flavobacterium psychrolimnae TaxID=249351 RepID=A0A366AYQ2_9FLAO|nr:hypothetical protein DR980_15115 [Flavobacterium psychrolimnae]